MNKFKIIMWIIVGLITIILKILATDFSVLIFLLVLIYLTQLDILELNRDKK